PAARRPAPGFARSLSTRQAAALIAANEEEIQDPREILLQAVSEGRKLAGDDWNDQRDSAAEEAALLIAGLDESRAQPLIDKFKSWLDDAHSMDETAFKSKYPDPLQAAGKVTGDFEWSQVVKNWMDGCIADLVSNPQLSTAIDERLR